MQMGTAVIRYGEEGDLAAALLKGHVPGAQLVKDDRLDATLDLVIGNAYTALTPTSRGPAAAGPTQAADAHGRPPLHVTST